MGKFANDPEYGFDTFGKTHSAQNGWQLVSYQFAEDGSGVAITNRNGVTKTEIFGPRLKNLNISYSAYGLPIPITMGVRRLPGVVIWAAPLQERMKKTKKQGNPNTVSGSAGGGTDFGGLNNLGVNNWGSSASSDFTVTREYYYFADFAVSFGYGDPNELDKEIVRIWANGTLIYDHGSTNPNDVFDIVPKKLFSGYSLRFHAGEDDQEPDPTIMDYENLKYATEASITPGSVNIVPGYRGMMYAVFQNFPITPFGNSLPNIQIELADVTSRTTLKTVYTDMSGAALADEAGMGVDWNLGVLYSGWEGVLYSIDLATNAVLTTSTMDRNYRCLEYSPFTGSLYGAAVNAAVPITVDPSGVLAGTSIWKIDPYSGAGSLLQPYNILGAYDRPAFTNPDKIIASPVLLPDGSLADAVTFSTADGGTTIWAVGSVIPLMDFGSNINNCFVPGEITEGSGTFYIRSLGGVVQKYSDIEGLVDFYAPPVGYTVQGLCYSYKDNALLILSRGASDGTSAFVRADGTVLWEQEGIYPQWSTFFDSQGSYVHRLDMSEGVVTVMQSSRLVEIDLANGDILNNVTEIGPEPTYNVASYRYKASYGLKAPCYYDVPVVDRRTLKDFILFAADQADLDTTGGDAQILVDATLADIPIDGAYLAEPDLSFRGLLDNLRLAFLFDVIERDGVIRVKKRAEDDEPDDFAFSKSDYLIANSQNHSSFLISREADDTIPSRLSYHFLDYNRSFGENVVFAQRITESNMSTQTIEISIPIIMRMSEAKTWAYKVLYSLWAARNNYAFRLPPAEYDIEPGDAGAATSESRGYVVKINRVTYNDDFSMSVSAQSYMTDFPVVIEADIPRYEQPTIEIPSMTLPFPLDIPNPFPTDADDSFADADSATIFVYAGPEVPDRFWPGGTLYFMQPSGGSLFLGNINLDNPGFVGRTQSALVTTDTPFSFDDESELLVRLNNSDDTLVGIIDDEDFLNSDIANMLLIGGEIVRYRDATDMTGGVFKLQHFLRGLRGTEIYVNDHQIGEKVFFLTPNGPYRQKLEVASQGSNLTYRAETSSSQSQPRYATVNFQGNSNKPFAVAAVHATNNDPELTITWQPRTRAPGQNLLIEDDDEVVLDQWDDNTYLIIFYDDDTFSIELGRTFDDFTNAISADYTTATLDAAALTSIFGSSAIPTVVYMDIYQVSGVWGNGQLKRVTAYVE